MNTCLKSVMLQKLLLQHVFLTMFFFDWARLIRSCNDRIEMRWNLPAEIQNAMSIEARISSWNIGG